ncbi:helicase-related protein [Salinibacter ruber]|uniref:helicase-related protein n=1 Tax=Salinibacter ruber TaxID=146919 RepID=UPI0021673B6D|nr:SNF2 family DNA or RNA helicase [Salinibacter ruber]
MSHSSIENHADRIQALREEIGATQSQFADRIGVSHVTVNRWENGKNTPNDLAWEKIQKIERHVFGDQESRDSKSDIDQVDLDFEGSPRGVKSLVEAKRLRNAHRHNPTFASEISRIDPLPHQRIAVYERMLEQPRLRFLLADDAGAGKTIMSGLYIREMLSRRLLRRILIVPPAGLVGNWQRELDHLFNLDFDIVSGSDARSENPFAGPDSDQLIVSIDTLAADSAFSQLATEETQPYDLVIFDEAHKLSVRKDADGRLDKTNRYRLAEAIAGIREEGERWRLPWRTHHLLLLTATPHMGKDFPYYGLWRLLEPEVLSTQDAFQSYPTDARRRHFIRRTKEEMVDYQGEQIYPTRISDTLSYELSDDERNLYEATTEYLDLYYNQARMLNRSAVHLAKSVFQRRLVSSTFALMQSFRRREEKLSDLVEAVREARLSEEEVANQQQRLGRVQDVYEEMTADEEGLGGEQEAGEVMEDEILAAVADVSIEKLEEERREVRRLADQAEEVYHQGSESKFQRLLEVLDDPEYADEKMIIFSEHRDTVSFIVRRLEELGYTGKIARIHGGMPHEERDRQVEFFRKNVEDGGAQYLIATDAAGEGINLQFCWLMVNYDIPWNPARLEQRMGRIHRYGQDHDPVIIMNMVAKNTREGRVQQTLLEKLDRIRRELGSDKVFDVIGDVLEDVSIREYIERVLEEGDESAVQDEIDSQVTAERVQEIEKKQEETYGGHDDVQSRLPELREQRKREKFKHLLPGYVQQFVSRAAPLLGLEVEGDLDGYFRLRATEEGALEPFWPILESYSEEARRRLTTHKPDYNEECIWLHPEEPLFDRLRAFVTNRYRRAARRGAMFADPRADEPYLLYFLDVGIRRAADDNLEAFSRPEGRGGQFVAVRVTEDEEIEQVAPKSLLLLHPHEGSKTRRSLDVIAISDEMKDQARRFAKNMIAAEMAEKERERLRSTVEERVRFLRRGFDHKEADLAERRSELREQKRNDVPGAEKRYAEVKKQQRQLKERKETSIETIRREPALIEPSGADFVACAVVLPSTEETDDMSQSDEVEALAMQEAIAHERARGASVQDVSDPEKAQAAGLSDWPGFDLLSEHPETGMRGIEVKGRARVGDVTLHDNEWTAAINQRDDYWLYVVYDCATSDPRLIRIQDPFGSLVATPTGDVIIDEQEIFRVASE